MYLQYVDQYNLFECIKHVQAHIQTSFYTFRNRIALSFTVEKYRDGVSAAKYDLIIICFLI